MPSSAPLNFGWLLDYPTRTQVSLLPKGLKSHTAIIAQSGSGKSFALGRLLEEVAGKTQGRIIILDPNSDFVKFSEVDESAWEKHSLEAEDNLIEFKRRWANLSFNVFTKRSPESLHLSHMAASAVLP